MNPFQSHDVMTTASGFTSGDKVSLALNKTTGATSYTGLECAFFLLTGVFATPHTGCTAFHTLPENRQSAEPHT